MTFFLIAALFLIVMTINICTAIWLQVALSNQFTKEKWQSLLKELSALTIIVMLAGVLAGTMGINDIYTLLIGAFVFLTWWRVMNAVMSFAFTGLVINLPTMFITKIAVGGEVFYATEIAVLSFIGLLFTSAIVVSFNGWKPKKTSENP